MGESRFETGTVLAERYRLEAPIGRGGMGEVWTAEHLALRSTVAVKILLGDRASPEDAKRFLREARAMAQLRSPHIVQVFDVGEHDGALFIAMELLSGRSLKEEIDRRGRLDLAATQALIAQLAKGLARAHAAGIVHRDLKPGNIQLARDGDGEAASEVVKILDFGVVKLQPVADAEAPTTVTHAGGMIGTPAYMSPEQLRGRADLDHRADLWALAIVAYECLLGERPYRETALGALVMAVCGEPAPVPSSSGPVPDGFDAWFLKATARDVDDRFQSIDALCDAFATVGTDVPFAGAPPSDAQRQGEPAEKIPREASTLDASATTGRRTPRRGWLGAFVLAAVAVGGYALYRDRMRGEAEPALPSSSGLASASARATTATQPLDHASTSPAKPRQLTFTGIAREVALSPDGSTAYYGVRKDGSAQGSAQGAVVICRQALPDGEPREIATMHELHDLTLSPDGKQLLVGGPWKEGDWGPRVLDDGGGVVRTLPSSINATWGPDGSVLAIAQSFAKEIVVHGADGSTRTLPLSGSYDWLWDIAWSEAAGRILVTVASSSGDPHLLAMSKDGGPAVEVLPDLAPWRSFVASPDGKRIVVGHAAGSESEIVSYPIDWATGAATGAPTRLLATTPAEVLATSADGARIAFVRRDVSSNLWGAELRDDEMGKPKALTRGTHAHGKPSLSPDGRRVAFLRDKAGRNGLYAMPFEGGTEARVTRPELDVGSFAWRPDGGALVVAARDGRAKLAIYVIASDGGGERVIALDEAPSAPPDLAWSSDRIWVQLAGNRDFARVDPATGEQDRAFGDEVGWRFGAMPSASGALALVWNRPGLGEDGIWIVPRTGAPRKVAGTTPRWPYLKAWSDDERSVFALFRPDGGPATIERFAVAGRAHRVVATLGEGPIGDADISSHGDRIVYEVKREERDVWTYDLGAAP